MNQIINLVGNGIDPDLGGKILSVLILVCALVFFAVSVVVAIKVVSAILEWLNRR